MTSEITAIVFVVFFVSFFCGFFLFVFLKAVALSRQKTKTVSLQFLESKERKLLVLSRHSQSLSSWTLV